MPGLSSLRSLSLTRRRWLQALTGSAAVKAGQMGLALLVAITLARLLGPGGYGAYAFAHAVAAVLALLAGQGLPQLVVRETARARAAAAHGRLHALWRWAAVRVAGTGLVFGGGLIAGIGLLGEDSSRALTLSAAAALVPLLALGRLAGGAVRGLGFGVVGQIPDQILRPALLLAGIGAAFGLVGWGPQAGGAIALHGAAAALALAVGVGLAWRLRPSAGSRTAASRAQKAQWQAAAWPMAWLAGMHLIHQHADLILLGMLAGDTETGTYRAAAQAAMLVLFGLQAVNSVAAPHLAHQHASGDMAGLQRLVTVNARAIVAAAIPPAVLFMLAGPMVLGWAFGAAYTAGGPALAVLAAGQLVNTFFGPVGSLLNMTGHERATVMGLSAGAVVNIGLNLALIPSLGMLGAATATAVALVVWNAVLWWAVRRRLGIRPTVLGV